MQQYEGIFNDSLNSDESKQPLAMVSIEIGQHIVDIPIYNPKDIPQLAKEFCQQFKLQQEHYQYILDTFNREYQQNISQQTQSPQISNSPRREHCENHKQQEYEKWQHSMKYKQDQLSNSTAVSIKQTKKQVPGDRLYREAVDNQKLKQARIEQYKQSMLQQPLKQQHQSLISPKSRQIMDKKLSLTETKDLYQRGLEYNKLKQEHIKKASQDARSKSPFKPQLMNRSITPVRAKYMEPPKKIIPIVQQKSKSPVSRQHQRIKDEQLYNEYQERIKKSEIKKKEFEKQTEPTFQPKIDKDVYYKKVVKQEQLEQNQNMSTMQTLTKKLNEASKQKSFEQDIEKIFRLLDSNHDGYISTDSLDLSQISGDVLEIICEVLYEMEENKLTLDLAQFQQLCSQYHIELPPILF